MIKIKKHFFNQFKKITSVLLAISMLLLTAPPNSLSKVEAIDKNEFNMALALPENSNPNFTIQHYFYFDKVKTSTSALSDDYLPFINTSSGNPSDVPVNKNTKQNVLDGISDPLNPKLTYVQLVDNSNLSDGRKELATEKSLIKLFEDEPTDYMSNPQIPYMNRLYNSSTDYNSDFTLTEIWVYQPSDNGVVKDTNSLTDSDFIKYPVPLSADGKTHDPEKMRFTNNPNNSHISNVINNEPQHDIATDDYPYYYTILIKKNTVVRLVFDTTTGEKNKEANFFDYDVTDGYIYTNATYNETYRRPTSSQTNDSSWYAYVHNSGINNDSLYEGTGSKYAFGNGIIVSRIGKDATWTNKWGTIYLNQANISTAYNGIAFGLLKNVAYNSNKNPLPVWSDGISAPAIFDDTKTFRGKTDYTKAKNNGYELGFYRQGTTYTLDKVINSNKEEVLKNLRGLMVTANGWSSNKPIYSNEFWPLDNSLSHGTDNHDLKFGNSAYKNRKFFFNSGDPIDTPIVDNKKNSKDHNAYFGMTYSVDFTVYPGYVSPLNYWFFGDDDMWVFLSKVDDNGNVISGSEKKIMDIGGVHAASGVYSNLWEYIDYNPLFNEDGTENTSPQKYRLTFFYTERGASGSSCYMRFTIPLLTNQSVAPERDEAIMIEKSYVDYDGNELKYDTNGEKFNFLLTMTNENGISFEDVYDYAIYRKDTTPDHTAAGAKPIQKGIIGVANPESGKYEFSLRSGEYIIISNLPENTHYTIEEVGSESYETYYQIGTHTHKNNKQIDTLNPNKYYLDSENVKLLNSKVTNYVKFTNAPLSYKDFSFKKVDVQNLTPLENAVFNIYEYTCSDSTADELLDVNNIDSCWKLHSSATSDIDGKVIFNKIYRNKKYRLVETKAPDEYELPTGQWNIDVENNMQFTITAIGDEKPLAFINNENNLLLPNVKLLDIPETGSASSILYTIVGTMLICASIIIAAYYRKNNNL